MVSPKRLKTIFKPLVIVVAAVYFVIDALALSVLKPLLRKIANLRFFAFIARWIASREAGVFRGDTAAIFSH